MGVIKRDARRLDNGSCVKTFMVAGALRAALCRAPLTRGTLEILPVVINSGTIRSVLVIQSLDVRWACVDMMG